MHNTLLENRPLAWAVLVCAVALGIFGVGGAKVKSVGAAAQDYYSKNMAADFTARETAAQSLLGIAVQLGTEDALVGPAQQALDSSRAAAASPAERYRAGEQLRLAIDLVYNALPAEKRDAVGGAAQGAWSEFNSRTSILSHSIPEYNKLARAAQKKLSGFPAGQLADLAGVKAEEMTA